MAHGTIAASPIAMCAVYPLAYRTRARARSRPRLPRAPL